MRQGLSLEDFAKLADLPAADVDELRRAGLLDLDGDGIFDDKDAFRLQVVGIFRERGLSLEEIVEATRTSSSGATRRIFGHLGTIGREEATERTGITSDQLEELGAAVGLGTGPFDESDIETFQGIRTMVQAGLPWEAIIEGARVFGDALRRIAESEIAMTHRFLCEGLEEQGADARDIGVEVFRSVEVVEPIVDKLILHLHNEHLLKAAVDHALLHLEGGSVHGKQEATITFIDLALFTSLTQAHGDEVAAGILDRFDGIVRGLVLTHGGTLVKQNGDAFMLVFRDPADSVRFALEVESRIAAESDFPEVRVGIHQGPVLYRVGDYVGNTVNIASRVSAMASAGTILVTQPVAEAARDAGIEVEEVGVRRARGVEEPLTLYRVRREHERITRQDPVCGMVVSDGGAGRVVHEGIEYVFCSPDCMKKFLNGPARYVPAVS